ncbi:hypothetical protein B0H12DRAFT_1143553, partial [Mycena haematopus]
MLLFRSRWLHLPAPSDGRALVANVWRLVSRLRFFCAHRAWNAEKAAAQSHSYEPPPSPSRSPSSTSGSHPLHATPNSAAHPSR